VVIRQDITADNAVDDALRQARSASDCGVRDVWFGQRYDLDALMLAAIIGAAVPELNVGTAIVPINPRHPLLIASAAQPHKPHAMAGSASVSAWAATISSVAPSAWHPSSNSPGCANT
jgi:hypothetical protein